MYDAGQMFRKRQVVLDWIGLTAGIGVSTALGNVHRPKLYPTRPPPVGQVGYSLEHVPSKVTVAEKA